MHTPVLLQEAIQYLDPKPNENFIDCTFGEGGHALEILKHTAPNGRVLGIDWDAESLQATESRILKHESRSRLTLVDDSFANIEKIAKRKRFWPVHGVLFDLGLSSWQLEESGRGFSFQRDEPLQMRFAASDAGPSAADVLRRCSEEQLEKILREYGEERFARRIAHTIVGARRNRRIERTGDLVDVVMQATPPRQRRANIHPATRTFQALRIAVNDELANLAEALEGAMRVLEQSGRIAVISFHSLEDRVVKNFFRERQKAGVLALLTKKPVRPSREEIWKNPRSRSAKLRAAIKNFEF